MDAPDRLVVVISPLSLAHSEAEGIYAARFGELGLTSFGKTPEDAITKVKRMFNAFIHSCREFGLLESTLDRLGVQWHWADEYPDDGPEYENTNETAPADSAQALATYDAEEWVEQAANHHLAAAA